MARTKLEDFFKNKWIRKFWKPVSMALASLVLIVGFQNCAKQNFSRLEQATTATAASVDPSSPDSSIDPSIDSSTDPSTDGPKNTDPLSFDGSEQLKINNGAQFTKDVNVALTMSAPNATHMYITNDNTCASGGSWEAYEVAKAWVLGQPNEHAKVYAKFRDKDLVETNCISAGIIHDNIPPAVAVKVAAPALTNKNSVVTSVEVSDSGSGVDQTFCLVPGQTASLPCDGSYDGKSLSDGAHMVQFSAVDKAGNASEVITQSFIVDLTPPTVTLNQTPQVLTGSLSAVFEFSGSDALSGIKNFECKLDQGSYADCVSGQTYPPFSEGDHSFSVRSVDNAGNTSAAAEHSWKIDRLQPTLRFTSTPNSIIKSLAADFAFEGQDSLGNSINKFECKLNNGAFAACSSPISPAGVVAGTNTFVVRGYSSLNIASAELSYQWKVDLTPPTVTIPQGPDSLTNLLSANFAITAADAESGIATVMCTLNGGAAQDCSSLSQPYQSLEPNREHTFVVIATDKAGNSKSAQYKWIVDTLPPVLVITAKPDLLTKETTATFSFSATDTNGPITYKCGWDSEPLAACSSPSTRLNLADGAHIFYVQAQDAAENLSAVKSYAWTIKTVGPALAFPIKPNSIINTTDQGVLQYTIVDPTSPLQSSTCILDTTNLPCTLSGDTITFPLLTPGTHTFTLTATNSLGLPNQLSYTFEVEQTCTTSFADITDPVKVVFIVDASASNGQIGCNKSGNNCTDPGKVMRVGSIEAFANTYGSRPNFSWGLSYFKGSSATALIKSGSQPTFANHATLTTQLNYFKNSVSDSGVTPYVAALNKAYDTIDKDPAKDSSTNKPMYIVVFISDGRPNGEYPAPTEASLRAQVKSILDLSPGRISLSTVYYGPTTESASDLLGAMADTGKGKLLDTNVNPTGVTEIIDSVIKIPVQTCQ
ncbi:MAG: Ig-like domain repeat protein [Pseudobdellovibrionaceae bacterium]